MERFLLRVFYRDYVPAKKRKPTINPFGRWKSHWPFESPGCRESPSVLVLDKNYFHETRCNTDPTRGTTWFRSKGQEDQACFHRYFPRHPLHAWVYNPRRGVPRYALSEPRSSSKFIRVARRARSLRQRTESFRALLFSLGFVTHRVHGTFIWWTRSRRHL